MIIDLHNDLATKLLAYGQSFFSKSTMHIDADKLSRSGVDAMVFAAYCDPHFRGADAECLVMGLLDALEAAFTDPRSPVSIVRSAAELHAARAQGKLGAVLGVEGGYAIESDLASLDRFYNRGVRMMTLTHSKATSWAGADHDEAARGLTALGREVVRHMNDLGMIVDVAHTSTETILAAAHESRSPIVYSHGGVRALAGIPRAIDDEAARRVADTGGLIALSFFPPHLRRMRNLDHPSKPEEAITAILEDHRTDVLEKFRRMALVYDEGWAAPPELPGIDALFENIDYLVRLVGEDFVGLGSDFDGIPYACRGLEDVTSMGAIEQVMRENGYSNVRVGKIMGGNAWRVLGTVLKPAVKM